MIDIFESTAQLRPEAVFFTAVDRRGNETAYTYRQARLIASQLARRLRDKGVFPGDAVAVDLPNGPMYVFLALAAAYGGFALVALNHRLTDAEKLTRVLELERAGLRVAYTVDAAGEPKLFEAVCNSLLRNERAGRVDDSLGGSVEDAIHFAERAAHVFDSSHRALIMFTSGTTGKPKAAELTWGNLVEASKASNRVLSGRVRGRGLWQAVLPFFHVGGFQVLVRSVCSRWPLRIYERFDAAAVLRDAEVMHATHISVVDKMLQDMLNARPSALAQYECVLLGGGPLNAKTVARALEAGGRVYASYGMTETSSQVANTLITPQFTGGMRLLPGYSARIVEPDAAGFGRLALRGPGVFGGYANARAPFTVDGFFLTGDTAALHDGCLYVRERTGDMFISGGENVYPAEIVGIVGESGSGKSSLMKCLFFDEEATSGDVRARPFDGGAANLLALSPQQRRAIRNTVFGMVYQNPYLGLRMDFSSLSNIAEQMIASGSRNVGAMRSRGEDLLGRVNIPLSRATEPPRNFSGGMQQRVQIAKALSNNPPILLLDEVTTGLDLSVQAAVLDLVQQIRRDFNVSMLVVSHDLGVIRMLADRTLVMLDGRVIESGLTDQILEDPQHSYTQQLVYSLL